MTHLFSKTVTRSLATLAFLFPFSLQANAEATIDLLIVYTSGTNDLYAGDPMTRFNHLVATANQIYSDSGIDLQLNIKHSVQVNYTDTNNAETALNDITNGSGAFSSIAGLREVHEADMVVLFRPYHANHGSCGLAWIGGMNTNGDFSAPYIKNYQYSHVAVNSCGDYVTAHELGHNMGLRHSRKQDGSGGTLSYALGHGVNSQFTTIMAYQSEFNVDYWTGKVYKFSNPDITCKGLPCGVDRFQSQGADARFALNITGPQIANFFGDPNATVQSELQIAHGQMNDAETAYNDAVQAKLDSDAAYAAKKEAEKAAKVAVKDAKRSAKDAAKAYSKSLKDQAKAAKKAANYLQKAQVQLDKYNATGKAAYQAKYNDFMALYNSYSDQADAFASTAEAQEPAVLSTTQDLTDAITDYEAKKQARIDEKDQNKLLKQDENNKKKVWTTLVKQYNNLLKNWS
ncbi:zinc-dependent metalloprotease [Ketobacter sp.]|uniref:zinc-dependent metalloprotease n=1 Tax=Ketobacter sp. TaxID=2083498 RepID=UPI0025BE3779|nr:zinc-dependent metalloprotease [Ketobacter sp.]